MTNGNEKLTRLSQWLRIDPSNKPRIYTQIYATADMSNVNYWAEIILSAGIATLGLVLNSPAVIIGAMLISPLMGPIMATGLALAAGDLYLAVKAIIHLACSILAAVAFSGLIVWLLPFHSATGEILARTNPNLLDLGIALFSGLAGSIAVSRSGGADGVTTLPGVAIAVALMPPLCTIGFGLGSGANTRIMGGAGLLFLTNLVAIVASAFLIFLLIGMNSPEIRAEMEHSRSNELIARKLATGRFSRIIANGGKLHWRVLVLVVLLASIAISLRTALMQVAGEAIARGAVQEAIRKLIPRGTLVSQQVEVSKKAVAVQLISTKEIPAAELRAAEQSIQQRSGRKAEVTVASIASQSELAELMQRISTTSPPPPPAPTEKPLADIATGLNGRLQPALDDVWPQEAPLQDYSLAFSPGGITLDARYQASRDLDSISIGLIEKQIRDRLGAPSLNLTVHRLPLPRKGRSAPRPRH